MRTSVVVPAYDSWHTLPGTLEALRAEVDRPERELILVESTGTHTREELERRWPWVRAVTPTSRMLPGPARNLALEHARGELSAFTDADAVPEPGWIDELEHALRPGIDAVAGAVVNGTPGSAVGTSDYLLEFAAWFPGRRGEPLHGATCNLLVRRDVLVRAGGFPTDLWPGEDTVFTFRLGEAGRLAFAPAARVRHLNRTRFPSFVRHQYQLGSSFAQVCREVRFPHRTFTRLPLSLVAGPLRVPVLGYRLARWRALRSAGPAVVPLALAGGVAWSLGLTVGAVRRLTRRGPRARLTRI
jgi:GT2 family glycosyltransferase